MLSPLHQAWRIRHGCKGHWAGGGRGHFAGRAGRGAGGVSRSSGVVGRQGGRDGLGRHNRQSGYESIGGRSGGELDSRHPGVAGAAIALLDQPSASACYPCAGGESPAGIAGCAVAICGRRYAGQCKRGRFARYRACALSRLRSSPFAGSRSLARWSPSPWSWQPLRRLRGWCFTRHSRGVCPAPRTFGSTMRCRWEPPCLAVLPGCSVRRSVPGRHFAKIVRVCSDGDRHQS